MKLQRLVFLILGTLFVVLGLIGIFLPLLPTTPFLLLAAYFLSRSSEKFHQWLINHKKLGPPIHDWQKNQVIRTKYKIMATAMILLTSTLVIGKERIPVPGQAAYALVLGSVLIFLWTRKGRPDQSDRQGPK